MGDLIDPKSEGEETSCDDSIDNILKLRPKIVARRRLQGPTSQLSTNSSSNDGFVEDKKSTNAGKLWEEATVMRSLEEKLSSGNTSSIAELRDRGVETYALDLGQKKFNLKNRKNRKRRSAIDVCDSILEQEVEDIGGDNQREETTSKPAEGQLWDDVDVVSKEIPLQPSSITTWRKGRANKFKRFKPSRKHENQQQKQQKEFVPPEQFLPRRLVTADFEKDKLSSTVLDPETLEMDHLADRLVEALGEKEPDIMRKAVELVGKQIAVEIFKKCQEIEQQGGMLTKKGDRRRTPGGVFMQIFSEREDISDEKKKELFTLGNKLMKKKRKELKKTFKGKHKNKRDSNSTNDLPLIENDLPTSSDVFKVDIASNDNSEGC